MRKPFQSLVQWSVVLLAVCLSWGSGIFPQDYSPVEAEAAAVRNPGPIVISSGEFPFSPKTAVTLAKTESVDFGLVRTDANSSFPSQADPSSMAGESVTRLGETAPPSLGVEKTITPASGQPYTAGTVQTAVYGGSSLTKPPVIPVLNYHSVTIEPGNIVVISPAKLKEQMAYLKKNEYHPLTLGDFIAIMDGRMEAPSKPVLLTFDDGYTDNYEEAMPILKEFGFPATLYVSPGMTETPGYLNWDQIKEIQKAGWDIQPHGMTHPSLPKLNAEEQRKEILEAKKQIEDELGTPAETFCYPFGEYNQTTLQILEEAGFRYAFTIDQGKTTSSQHKFKLKRIFVNGEQSLNAWISRL